MQIYSVEEAKDILRHISKDTKIYIGCDSINSKKWTTFVTAIVIHIDGSKGCRVLALVDREKRIKERKLRLMKEVHKSTQVALELTYPMGEDETPVLSLDQIEVHIDINPNPKAGSYEVYKQAMDYVKGQSFVAVAKPHAIAASSASDYFARRERLKV